MELLISGLFVDYNKKTTYRYTNADLKISLYVCVHVKAIPWKFCILNPKSSQVICQ